MSKKYKIIKHSSNYYNKQVADHFGIPFENFNNLGSEWQDKLKRRCMESIENTDFSKAKKIELEDFSMCASATGIYLVFMAQALDKGIEQFINFSLLYSAGLLSFQVIKLIINRLGIEIQEKKMMDLKEYIESELRKKEENSMEGKSR